MSVMRTRCERSRSEDRPKERKNMKATLITPIESLKGQLKKDGYYFRMYRGQQIVQKCPTKWQDTPARKAARERFAAVYARRKADAGGG